MLFSQNVRSLFSTYRYPLSFVFAVGLFAYSQKTESAISAENWDPPPHCEVQAQDILQACIERALQKPAGPAQDQALDDCACEYYDVRKKLCGPDSPGDPLDLCPTPTPTPTPPPTWPPTPPPTYPPASPYPSSCSTGTCNNPGY